MNGYWFWIGGALDAMLFTVFSSWKLVWRLFLLVPAVEGTAMVLCANLFGIHGVPLSRLVIDLDFYVLVLFYTVYAVVFHGVWTTLFGGLTYLAVRSSSLPQRVSRRALLFCGLSGGGLVGLLYGVVGAPLFLTMGRCSARQVYTLDWRIVPALVASAVGGAMVLYYAFVDSSARRNEATPPRIRRPIRSPIGTRTWTIPTPPAISHMINQAD